LILNKAPNIFTKVFLFAVILVTAFAVAPTVYAQDFTPVHNADFRIIEISNHQGQLLVEVEHFKDGEFDYFENYMWQGREGISFPRATDSDGFFLLANGLRAPFEKDIRTGLMHQYAPQYYPGHDNWKRDRDTPYLDQSSILEVIKERHTIRANTPLISGEKKRGQSRLIEPNFQFNIRDAAGINLLLQKFAHTLPSNAYLIQPDGDLGRYTGALPDVNPGLGLIEYGTVSTFYPSLNGDVGKFGVSQTWSTLRNTTTSASGRPGGTAKSIEVNASGSTNIFSHMSKIFTLFDTSDLPDSTTITDATLGLVAISGSITNDRADSLTMVATNPASDATLVTADFTAVTYTKQATDIALSGITADSSAFTSFTLNATGLSNIDVTGISKFGIVALKEFDNNSTWVSGDSTSITFAMADTTLPGDKRPRLVVTYTNPAAAITGTIGDGATEQEVRDGGGTILVTLTDDTWVADGATFDAQRQAIIDGLDAATTPTTGWNNEVRDSIGVASVVRTSDTLATITISASEVAGYAIASTETITLTVPGAALTSGSAITATPTIAITAVTETAAITGTIGDGATEQEVRDGGGTILITLANTTWVPAAASEFDNQRQNIIDGLVAADSQTYGWNNEVKDRLGVTAVVRTSDTLVTITIPAGDVEDYRIVTNEVITTTVPATAIGGAALVATPTTTITGTVESAAVSGTLGGSGGTAPEIVAGGETVILTLTNTAWVTAGATFNAQRQNILDGLVADDSDVNGWNAMAFAVGDVVRTSGTIVTITLSAESGYAIPSAETVTTTVPASAIVYGAALVAPETFTISPAAFATSGTRVSTAIDLSSVTDLAYCAIGWETTLPANTAVGIETSVDGGVTYSTATNGNCPTGLTLGESLLTITDFRVKATLTTTDTSATPLITALGLIVEDAGGSELCYQLLTTPSASLADNCGTYTGTMSYPIGPSTITSSTAPITSTADPLPNPRSLAGQDVAQAVTGSATSARLFPAAGDEGGFVGLPLNDLVNEMSTVGDGLPVRFVWFIFLGIATIGAGMLAVHLTSNLFIAAGAMAAVMGFQMAIGSTGLLPGWILFAFIPLAAAFLLFRRGFPV
jgi:hypothetical protein